MTSTGPYDTRRAIGTGYRSTLYRTLERAQISQVPGESVSFKLLWRCVLTTPGAMIGSRTLMAPV